MRVISRRVVIISVCAGGLRIAKVVAAPRDLEIAEGLIVEAVNAGRARLAPELPPLIRDPALDAIARERSEAMAHGAPFDHDDGTGHYPGFEKIHDHYSRFGAMGENIVRDFNPAGDAHDPKLFAARAVESWFKSEGHRENIVSAAFTRCGVGVAMTRTTVYATQVFWGPPVPFGERRSR